MTDRWGHRTRNMGRFGVMLTLLLFLGMVRQMRTSVAAAKSGSDESGAPHVAQETVRRVVAYFPLWLRKEGYRAQSIDFSVVTTVAHFAVTPQPDGSIVIPDWGTFPDPNLINTAHAHGASVILVVGGDDPSAATAFSALAATEATREVFITNLVDLVLANGYDGVDLDWEFPANAMDRADLSLLVAELRQALGNNLSLSIAAPASDWYGRWFDVAALMPNLNWLGAMTYLLSVPDTATYADNNAALYTTRSGEVSVDASTQYWLGRGVPPQQLLIGLPFFGQQVDATGLHQPLLDRGGDALAYANVVDLIGNGWIPNWDPAAQVPYLQAANGLGIISYDDPASIAAKCAYTVSHGLGGVIIWHLGQDGIGSDQPLLEAARGCRS